MMSPAPTATTWRRKRPRVVVLLTTALCCLPSAVGFGLSGVGALSPTRAAVADAALVRAAAAARCGERTAEWRKKRRAAAHEITCKVSSPRRYGSAVSDKPCVCVWCLLQGVRNSSSLSLSLFSSLGLGWSFTLPGTCCLSGGTTASVIGELSSCFFVQRAVGESATVCCYCLLLCCLILKGGRSCFIRVLPEKKAPVWHSLDHPPPIVFLPPGTSLRTCD